jgi:YD repeat-containing protein
VRQRAAGQRHRAHRRPGYKGTKETTPGQERHYTWQWMDGRELRFNHRGRLTRISLPSGEQVRLDYNAKGNRLLKVTDPQGRSLRLHYAQSSGEGSFTGVQAIDTRWAASTTATAAHRCPAAPSPRPS